MAVHDFSVVEDPDRRDYVADLLGRVALHDRLAFHELYLCASPRLYGIALALARDASTAGEALQDAMLQIWQKAAQFDPARGTAAAWMAGILRFRVLDLLSTQNRRKTSSLDDMPELSDSAVLERLEATASGNRLRRCLAQLEAKNRESILLSFVHGYSHVQIAARLDIPLGTVKAWIRRGLFALKACLGS